MRIKPENLRLANTVLSIKESSSSKHYWNGVHRFITQNDKLLIKSTDSTLWIEWYIPFEGDPLPLDSIISHAVFEPVARYIEGGSLDLALNDKTINLTKDRFNYPMKGESTRNDYPEPKHGQHRVTWTCSSKLLADALRFVSGFIDEVNPNADRSVATLRSDGVLMGGNPQRCVIISGLVARADMSFKSRTARSASAFMNKIGKEVEVTVTSGENSTYILRDPEQGHSLTVLAESGRFPTIVREVSSRLTEVNLIDRKTLLTRCQAFSGNLSEGQDKINLTFQGMNEHSSLRVFIPGEGDIAQDEFPVFRKVPDIAGESDENRQSRMRDLSSRGPSEFSFNCDYLAHTLSAMEGNTVTFKCCGNRMVLVEDEDNPTEEQPERLSRSVLLTARQVTQRPTAPPETPATAPTQPTTNQTESIPV